MVNIFGTSTLSSSLSEVSNTSKALVKYFDWRQYITIPLQNIMVYDVMQETGLHA